MTRQRSWFAASLYLHNVAFFRVVLCRVGGCRGIIISFLLVAVGHALEPEVSADRRRYLPFSRSFIQIQQLLLMGLDYVDKESCRNSVVRFSCRGSHLRQTLQQCTCSYWNDIMRSFCCQLFASRKVPGAPHTAFASKIQRYPRICHYYCIPGRLFLIFDPLLPRFHQSLVVKTCRCICVLFSQEIWHCLGGRPDKPLISVCLNELMIKTRVSSL